MGLNYNLKRKLTDRPIITNIIGRSVNFLFVIFFLPTGISPGAPDASPSQHRFHPFWSLPIAQHLRIVLQNHEAMLCKQIRGCIWCTPIISARSNSELAAHIVEV